MEKDTEKLAQLGELHLKRSLSKILQDAKYLLDCSKDYNQPEQVFFKKEFAKKIKGIPELYEKLSKASYEKYGVDFPDLQENYKQLLPQINQLLEEVEVKK